MNSDVQKSNSHHKLVPDRLFLVDGIPIRNVVSKVSFELFDRAGVVGARDHYLVIINVSILPDGPWQIDIIYLSYSCIFIIS